MFFGETPSHNFSTMARGDPATLGELWEGTYEHTIKLQNANARAVELEREYDARNDEVFKATGTRLPNPMRDAPSAEDYNEIREEINRNRGRAIYVPEWLANRYNTRLKELAQSKPDLAYIIRPDDSPDIVVAKRAKALEEKTGNLYERRNMVQLPGFGGALVGGVANIFRDPFGSAVSFGAGLYGQVQSPGDLAANLLPFGAGRAAQSILKNAMKNAGLNAAAQAVLQPQVEFNRMKMGLEYGVEHGLGDIGGAAGTGFALDVAVRAPVRAGMRRVAPDAGPYGGVFRDAPPVTPDTPVTPDIPPAPQRPAIEIPPDLEARLEAGDASVLPDIQRVIDGVPELADDPVVRGAAAEVARDLSLPAKIDGIEDGDALNALAQTVRSLVDTQEPRPRLPDETPETSRFDLEAATRLLTERDADIARLMERVRPELDRMAPGTTERINALVEAGLSDLLPVIERALKAEDADKAAAGFVRDVLSLAQTIPPERMAALADLASGGGNPATLARHLRSFPDLADRGLPQTEAIRMARSLARLSDDAFARVERGSAEPRIAQVVADHVDDLNRHGSLLDDLARAGITDPDEARRALPDLMGPPRDPDAAPLNGAGLIDDPNGKEAQAQTERLNQHYAAEIAEDAAKLEARKVQAEEARQVAEAEQAIHQRVEEIKQIARDMGMVPQDVPVKVFTGLDDLDPALRAQVERTNLDAFADALSVFQRASTDAERLAARQQMELAKANRAVEGFHQDGVVWIAATALDPEGRIAHEVVHALVEAGRLTRAEVRLLAERARALGILTPEREALYRATYARRGVSEARLDEMIDEEAAAHFVEAYKKLPPSEPDAKPDPETVKAVGIVARLMELFQRLRERLLGTVPEAATAPDPVRVLLDQLIAGEISQRQRVHQVMAAEDLKTVGVREPQGRPVEDTSPVDPVTGDRYTPEEIDSIVDMWRYIDEVRRQPKPETLVSYLRRMGGINDERTEVRYIAGGANQRPGLVSKRGLDLDDAALMAWEQGYFKSAERPSIQEFLELIDEDLRTNAVFKAADEAVADDIRAASDMANELDKLGIGSLGSEQAIRDHFKSPGGEGTRGRPPYAAGPSPADELDVPFGPMFAIADGRFDLEPVNVAANDSYRGRKFEYNITRDGQSSGITVRGYAQGDRAVIDWIGPPMPENSMAYPAAQFNPNSIGPSGLRQLMAALQRDFPDVKTFAGDRITGARAQARGRSFGDPMFAIADRDTGRSMRAEMDALGFRSKALEAARSLKQSKGTPEQMLAQLKSAGVKDAEIEATGLREFLDRQSATEPSGEVAYRGAADTRQTSSGGFRFMSPSQEIASWFGGTMHRYEISPTAKRADVVSAVDPNTGDLLPTADPNVAGAIRAAAAEQQESVNRFLGVMIHEGDAGARHRQDILLPRLKQAGYDIVDLPDNSVTGDVGTSIVVLTDNAARLHSREDRKTGTWVEAAKPTITRDEIVSYLTENRVGLMEVQYGSTVETKRLREARRGLDPRSNEYHEISMQLLPLKAREQTKWSNYSLDPSNPTYRETVIHLPEETARTRQLTASVERREPRLAELEASQRADAESAFRSGHFSEPNIVGHMMTSMVKHEGKPTYLIDQIQSDWGQKLRDGGVRDEAKIAQLEQEKDVASREMVRTLDAATAAHGYDKLDPDTRHTKRAELHAEMLRTPSQFGSFGPAYSKAFNDYSRLGAELSTARASSPGHPLVNTTDQWVNTTLRRAIRQAAEADAEYIAIPHGDTVLSYNPGDEGGMRGFYGSRDIEGILPKNLRKLLEKIDKTAAKPIKVEQVEASQGLRGWNDDVEAYPFNKSQTGFTLFPLTDTVKRSVINEGQMMFAFAGEKARTADLDALAKAKEMETSGQDRRDIWTQTGWFRGTDGKWRFEIDDSNARMSWLWRNGRLGSVMPHRDLYRAYPDLANVKTRRDDDIMASGGYKPAGRDEIGQGGIFARWRNPEKITYSSIWEALQGPRATRDTLLHEAQHAIQYRENFPRGASTREFSYIADGAAGLGGSPRKEALYDWIGERFGDEGLAGRIRQRINPTPRYDHARAAVTQVADEMMKRDGVQYAPSVQEVHAKGLSIAPERVSEFIDAHLAWQKLRKDYEDRAYKILNDAAYHRSAGEVEARNVVTRANMTPAERRATPPWMTQDVPDERQYLQYYGSLSPIQVPRLSRFSNGDNLSQLSYSEDPPVPGAPVMRGQEPDQGPMFAMAGAPQREDQIATLARAFQDATQAVQAAGMGVAIERGPDGIVARVTRGGKAYDVTRDDDGRVVSLELSNDLAAQAQIAYANLLAAITARIPPEQLQAYGALATQAAGGDLTTLSQRAGDALAQGQPLAENLAAVRRSVEATLGPEQTAQLIDAALSPLPEPARSSLRTLIDAVTLPEPERVPQAANDNPDLGPPSPVERELFDLQRIGTILEMIGVCRG